jgi:outer membrane cobalamin receptor
MLLCVLLGACAHNTEQRLSDRGRSGDRHVVTATDIERTGARTVWDAIRHTLPEVSLREDRNGRPTRVARRGQSSIVLTDQPLILLDRVPISDLARLSEMPASDVQSMELLTGIHATTYFGTNSGDGVLIIRTKSGTH